MRPGLFGQLIPKLRLSDGKAVVAGDNWQLWEATEDRAFGSPEKLYLLYFDSRANWTTARQAIEEGRNNPGTDGNNPGTGTTRGQTGRPPFTAPFQAKRPICHCISLRISRYH